MMLRTNACLVLVICSSFASSSVPSELADKRCLTLGEQSFCPSFRKSVEKCTEYRSLANIEPCNRTDSPVISFTEASPGEFPHMAAIGWPHYEGYSFDCGGALISEAYVLTAAHCLAKGRRRSAPTIVRLGMNKFIEHQQHDTNSSIDYAIERLILHPEYNRSINLYNDVGLIKLAGNVEFNHFIRPACLYPEDKTAFTGVLATAYSSTGSFHSRNLHKVTLEVYESGVCNNSYQRVLPEGIRYSQLCVERLSRGKDFCVDSDSGPLQVVDDTNKCLYLIVGFTSFGDSCGTHFPGIYTKVPAYLDWIESVIWP